VGAVLTDSIQNLIDKYIDWLKSKTALRPVNDWVEITTPYLDRHNDYIQIYAKPENGSILLSDDGYVLNDLEISGGGIDTPKRKALLMAALNGFGVKLSDGRLEVRASEDSFAMRKHNLVQAILAVGDLFYLAAPMVASLFYEDVVKWLDDSDVRYTPNVKLSGKSGYDHRFEFVIPKSKKRPERLLQTVNRPDRTTAETLAFSWVDTREVRANDSMCFAFLNDTERRVSPAILDALRIYDITPVPWSEREAVRLELAA